MCFDNDYGDWTVMESESETVKSNGSRFFKCYDCQLPLMDGEECVRTNQWEHEKCPLCGIRHQEDDDCDGEESGESFHMVQCMSCLDLRKAIKDLEMKDGCAEHEALPMSSFGEEFGDMQDGGRVQEYLQHAKEMFPERAAFFDSRYGEFCEVEE